MNSAQWRNMRRQATARSGFRCILNLSDAPCLSGAFGPMRTTRTFLCSLVVLTVAFAGCRPDTPAIPLSIYIVSQEKVENGQFIDTSDFPKLGYIGPKPDLTIAKLEEVNSLVITESGQSRPGIIITLRTEDAEKFASLTERAVTKKTLLMVGDMALTAPMVTSPMRAAQATRLQFTCPTQAAQTQIESGLRKLTQ